MGIPLFLSIHPAFFFFVMVIVGMLMGSFLNMAVYRLPLMLKTEWRRECQTFLALPVEASEKINFFTPRSHCPFCKNTLTWWQNIPVFSYLFLCGKCASCKIQIPIRYFLLEIASIFLTIVLAIYYGPTISLVLALIFTWILLALFFIDLAEQLLPDSLTLSLLWIGLLASFIPFFLDTQSAIIGAVVGYSVLWIIATLFRLVTGKEGMGHGDFKLCAALGAWVGWQSLVFVWLLSSLLGILVSVSRMLMKKQQRNTPIPFGPFLAMAGWFMLLWGQDVMSFYLRWAGGM